MNLMQRLEKFVFCIRNIDFFIPVSLQAASMNQKEIQGIKEILLDGSSERFRRDGVRTKSWTPQGL